MLNLQERRTKIVCTIGPASDSKETLEALIDAGMSIARINFSHGTHEEHREKVQRIRELGRKKNIPIAILQDLSGPKIRIGKMKNGVHLEAGSEFALYKEKTVGDATGASTSYPDIVDAVEVDDTVLLADGSIHLEVIRKKADRVICSVIVGGPLSSNKGINLPSRSLAIPSLTAKDKYDLELGIAMGVDLVALSFVRRPTDILKAKTLMHRAGVEIPIIAKIEKHEAIDAIDDLIDISDGIMVARGDLAVETALEQVPVVQKIIIEKCNKKGKPVITATQMLKSMVDSPRPTRAEATDVANAVFDGTDAVMLSEETAAGNYPVEAVQTMHRILVEAEKAFTPRWRHQDQTSEKRMSVQAAISQAAVVMSGLLGASAIVTPTRSGSSARSVARFRPRQPIVAICTTEQEQRRLCAVWGVYPYLVPELSTADEVLQASIDTAVQHHFARVGSRIIITAGIPPGQSGSTNLIKVEEIQRS